VDPFLAGFGDRVKLLAKMAGSNEALARMSGVSGKMIGKYIAGSQPRMEIVKRMAHASGVAYNWLATGQGPMGELLDEAALMRGEESAPVEERAVQFEARKDENRSLREIVDAVIKIMTSGSEETRAAFKTSVTIFMESVQSFKRIERLERDVEALKNAMNNNISNGATEA